MQQTPCYSRNNQYGAPASLKTDGGFSEANSNVIIRCEPLMPRRSGNGHRIDWAKANIDESIVESGSHGQSKKH